LSVLIFFTTQSSNEHQLIWQICQIVISLETLKYNQTQVFSPKLIYYTNQQENKLTLSIQSCSLLQSLAVVIVNCKNIENILWNCLTEKKIKGSYCYESWN